MKFYELVFQNDAAPTGFTREFFTSRRAAERSLAELKREHKAETAAHEKWEGGFYDSPPLPVYNPMHAHIKELRFSGTPREMILEALRYPWESR